MENGNPETRRPFAAAFAVSLVLNLFLAAVIGGQLLHRYFPSETPGGPLRTVLEHAEAHLSQDDARAFAAVMQRDSAQYAVAAKRVADDRAELERQIANDPFDAAATRKAFATWQADLDQFLQVLSGPLVDALAQVSPEGRRKLISERIAERLKRSQSQAPK